jgi:hypothetical protein
VHQRGERPRDRGLTPFLFPSFTCFSTSRSNVYSATSDNRSMQSERTARMHSDPFSGDV